MYSTKSGATATAGAAGAPPPPGGGVPPPPSPGGEVGGLTPESFNRDNLNILLESENIFDDDSFIDLSKGKNFLGEIENQLGKLLNDWYL